MKLFLPFYTFITMYYCSSVPSQLKFAQQPMPCDQVTFQKIYLFLTRAQSKV